MFQEFTNIALLDGYVKMISPSNKSREKIIYTWFCTGRSIMIGDIIYLYYIKLELTRDRYRLVTFPNISLRFVTFRNVS